MNPQSDPLQEFAHQEGLSPEDLHDLLNFTAMGDPDLREIPVGVREFVESPYYLGAAGRIYPVVMAELEALCDGDYVEAVFGGAIGSAKTTTALYVLAYELYRLSCYGNPHTIFELDPASEILIVFQSITASLAKAVDYARFRAMVASAPYFKRYFPFDHRIESEMRFPNRIIVKPVSGEETGAIGQNVIGGLLDELNFMRVVKESRKSTDGGTYDQAVRLYESIARRRKSRFLKAGRKIPGMLCLVSSARHAGSFTDRKIREAEDPEAKIYVYNKRVWDIRPWDFSGEMFRVFIGDAIRKPRVIEPGEIVPESDEEMIELVPVEFRRDFEHDILNSLRDIAGFSSTAIHPFMIETGLIAKVFDHHPSVFSSEEVDFETRKLMVVPDHFDSPEQPRFVHLDLAVTSDSVGITVGYVEKFIEVQRSDVVEILPKIRIDGILRVNPPPSGEIDFGRLRRVLYVMRDLGLNIRWITMDSYQSVDSIQILRQAGFITGQQSIDRTTFPYDVLKTAIYDGRVTAPSHPHTLKELRLLERVEDKGKSKIDHPPNGSKDCADSLAGVVYGLTFRREVWALHSIPPHAVPASLLSRGEQKGEEPVQEVRRRA